MTNTWMKGLLFSFAIALLGTLPSVAQSNKYLLALSKNDHTLAIVDPVSFKIIAKVPVGPDPHEVIASADGRTAYVSNYAGGSLHELDIIDLVNRKALSSVDTSPLIGLHGLTFAVGKLWFTAEGSKTIGRYDPSLGLVDWAMGTGQDRTHMIYVSPDGKKIYATNVSSGTVSVITDTLMQGGFGPPPGAGGTPGGGTPPSGGPATGVKPQARHDWKQTIVAVSKGSEGFDVTPDGKQLWTAAADDGTIAVIDLNLKKVVDKIDAQVLGANRLQFTPDGKMALVSSLRSGDLFVFDALTHKQITKISTGHGAAGILVDTDGSRAFIGCTGDNYVAVVNLTTMKVTGHINVGGGPDGLAWAVMK